MGRAGFIDDLTGLYNRRYLFSYLKKRTVEPEPFALLFTDLDYFREVNDTYGHIKGDEILAEVASVLQEEVKRKGLLARYAGDDFVIIFPGDLSRELREIPETLIEKVRTHSFKGFEKRKKIKLGMSIGIAFYPKDGTTPKELIGSADKAMYLAKKEGRNRVRRVEEITEEIQAEIKRTYPVSSPKLVGRDREIIEMEKVLKDVIAGQCRYLFFVGEYGMGKTRLMEELCKKASEKGFFSLCGECYEKTSSIPYYPFCESFRGITEKDILSSILKRIGMPYQGELVKLMPEWKSKISRKRIKPLLSQKPSYRLLEAVRLFWINILKEKPLVLVLDDSHWIDSSTLILLQYLIRNITNLPLLLCFSSEKETELMRTFDTLHKSDREKLLVKLKPLPLDDTYRMIGLIFNTPKVSQSFVEEIHKVTGGNPLFIEEILKTLLEEGLPSDPTSWKGALLKKYRIPPTLRTDLLHRIGRLDRETRELLELAAVIGADFSLETLLPLSNKNEWHIVDILSRSAKAQLVRESSEEGKYSFSNLLTKQVIYNEMEEKKRRAIHTKVGKAVEKNYRDRISEVVGELSHHFRLGGEEERAISYSIMEGEKNANLYANEDAIHSYETALELLNKREGKTEEKRKVLCSLGDLYKKTGDFDKAIEIYKKSLTLGGFPSQLSELFRKLGGGYRHKGMHERALAHYETGITFLREEEKSPQMAMLQCGMATVYASKGDYDKALELIRQGLATLGQLEKTKETLNGFEDIYSLTGRVFLDKGEYREAEGHLLKALKLSQELRDDSKIANCLSGLGILSLRRDKYSKALRYWREALRLNEKMGDIPEIARHYHNLGVGYRFKEEYDKAIDYQNRSLELFNRIGYPIGTAACFSCLADIFRLKGKYKKAMGYVKRNLEIYKELNKLPELAKTYVYSGFISQDKKEYREAIGCFEQALKIYEKMKSNRGVSLCYGNIGECYLYLGDLEKSRRYSKESLKIAVQKDLIGGVHRILGEIYTRKKEYSKAQNHFAESIKIFKSIGNKAELAKSCQKSAEMYKEKGEDEMAQKYLSLSKSILQKSKKKG